MRREWRPTCSRDWQRDVTMATRERIVNNSARGRSRGPRDGAESEVWGASHALSRDRYHPRDSFSFREVRRGSMSSPGATRVAPGDQLRKREQGGTEFEDYLCDSRQTGATRRMLLFGFKSPLRDSVANACKKSTAVDWRNSTHAYRNATSTALATLVALRDWSWWDQSRMISVLPSCGDNLFSLLLLAGDSILYRNSNHRDTIEILNKFSWLSNGLVGIIKKCRP